MTNGKTIKLTKIENGIDYATGLRKESIVEIIIDNDIQIERKALQMTVESPAGQVRNKNVRNENGQLVIAKIKGMSAGSGERSIVKHLFGESLKRIPGTANTDFRRKCFK